MKIVRDCDKLTVTDIEQLDSAHAAAFQTALREVLAANVRQIDLDLSQTVSLDCGGLGALLALRKGVGSAMLVVRLHNPPQPAQRLLRLTQTDQAFTVME
ncbi:MAG TPA: STAS domain-containing protein [Verrucomicrobiae bacterium]|nr:STAS domain-containing protein [Verrucomicrobiae bacterium]